MAGLAPGSEPFGPRRAFLWGVYVRPRLRERGVACGLLRASLEAASGHFDEITLDVGIRNHPARMLYEKFGFVRDGEPRPIGTGTGFREEIRMVNRLGPGVSGG